MLTKLFRANTLPDSQTAQISSAASDRLGLEVGQIKTESCFYIEFGAPLNGAELDRLCWLLCETFEPKNLSGDSFLTTSKTNLEIGPRLNFVTPFSSMAVTICHACGLQKITRLERSTRFGLDIALTEAQTDEFLAPLHDRMTQMRYREPLTSFESQRTPDPVFTLDVSSDKWRENLLAFSRQRGCGWDEQDLEFLDHLFREILKRDPTDVELFQLAQANSEHSRHGYFKGLHTIDGQQQPMTLMQLVKRPHQLAPRNSLLAFCDDSSAIRGFGIKTFEPDDPTKPSPIIEKLRIRHPTLTAETHNHPTRISPRPGAETGIGGDIRDAEAIGRGGLCGMHGAGYMVGALQIPGYDLPWEKEAWAYPPDGASPLRILLEGSQGVHGYGNCFGEPTTFGFVRSTAITLPHGEHRAHLKPILYVTAVGTVDDAHLKKGEPETGMLVVQLGGPAYRIGMGGGSGSSMIGGVNEAKLDFDSVQRGDAQMQQRHFRVIQACVAMGELNPIVSVHDLGAGGDCNALPEIVHPTGGRIDLRAIPCGDASLSALELWGNESQERMVVLCKAEDLPILEAMARREAVPCAVVGRITDDGQLVVHDASDDSTPVDLPLEKILGALPPKQFADRHLTFDPKPLVLPPNLTVLQALERVLHLPSIASKQFLTRGVDRSVRGLTAQQQCIGPNHLPLSDYAIRADSYFGHTGAVHSLGEKPMIGLTDPAAMARMTVAEALLNMVGAEITDLCDIKGSANWMLAAKLPGQGAWLFDAAQALSDICIELGIAIDGGKDSLSMAVKTIDPDGNSSIVKSPSTLVFSAYAPMPDVTKKATPDLKQAGNYLLLIDFATNTYRLGGSALAQVYGQAGDKTPDIDHPGTLKRAFNAIQDLVHRGLITSIHDRSEGGLIVTLLEMAFGGNLGIDIDIDPAHDSICYLFNEEPGLVIESRRPMEIGALLDAAGVSWTILGRSTSDDRIKVVCGGKIELDVRMTDLRGTWEDTSDALDRLQTNPDCVRSERQACQRLLMPPPYRLTFEPTPTRSEIIKATDKPRVAILREQGSNGDREMAAAFYAAGFEPWDVTMTDLLRGDVSLDGFRGLAFVGGFSFADVFDAAKGWAGVIRYNQNVRDQLETFRRRPDTFSLGVCNGCQLMALLGWVPGFDLPPTKQPRFIRNESGRFESRFSSLHILPSPAIMLNGMEGSTLGVWVAHGEGRYFAPDLDLAMKIEYERLTPFRYVDPANRLTTVYPFNPNGSPDGMAGLCSPDGRHLALMPHPERAFLKWQWPWMPTDWKDLKASPWLKLFQNAYDWCRG